MIQKIYEKINSLTSTAQKGEVDQQEQGNSFQAQHQVQIQPETRNVSFNPQSQDQKFFESSNEERKLSFKAKTKEEFPQNSHDQKQLNEQPIADSPGELFIGNYQEKIQNGQLIQSQESIQNSKCKQKQDEIESKDSILRHQNQENQSKKSSDESFNEIQNQNQIQAPIQIPSQNPSQRNDQILQKSLMTPVKGLNSQTSLQAKLFNEPIPAADQLIQENQNASFKKESIFPNSSLKIQQSPLNQSLRKSRFSIKTPIRNQVQFKDDIEKNSNIINEQIQNRLSIMNTFDVNMSINEDNFQNEIKIKSRVHSLKKKTFEEAQQVIILIKELQNNRNKSSPKLSEKFMMISDKRIENIETKLSTIEELIRNYHDPRLKEFILGKDGDKKKSIQDKNKPPTNFLKKNMVFQKPSEKQNKTNFTNFRK